MDLAEKKLALFDAHLSHKGLQHLVDCAAALFGNPLFMAYGFQSLGTTTRMRRTGCGIGGT